MYCQETNEGIVKDWEGQEMTNLNDKNIRMKLVNRYLNAETTNEEEQQLQEYYAQVVDGLTPDEEEVRMLLLTTALQPSDFTLSKDKADEFDRLMGKRLVKRNTLFWITSAVAAAIIAAFFLLTNKRPEKAINEHSIANVKPTETILPSQEEMPKENPSVVLEQKQTPKAYPTTATTKHMKKQTKRNEVATTANQVADIMAASNYQGQQVESYQLQPAGDATIITKTLADGTTTSYIVCSINDNEAYHVIPINIDM